MSEDLSNKSTEQLQRIKLEKEIVALDRQSGLEKYRSRVDLFKLVLVGLITGLVSLYTGYKLKSYENEYKDASDARAAIRKLEETCLGEADPTRQAQFACHLLRLPKPMDSTEIKVIQLQFEPICAALEGLTSTSTQAAKDTLLPVIADMRAQLKASAETIKRLSSNAEQQTDPKAYAQLQQQIEQQKRFQDSLLSTSKEGQQVIAQLQNVEKAVTSVSAESQALQGSPAGKKSAVLWFKEGYFLQFDEHRVLCQYLDKQLGIQVQVCRTKGTSPCATPLVTKQWIRRGVPYEFTDEGHRYRINLEAIDHGGKNPFNLAAYITFETLN